MTVHAFGTLIQRGDGGGPENFTTIAEVLDIRGPGIRRDTSDKTNHSSPSGWEEVMPGIKRSGEVTFSVNFIPTENTHDAGAGLLKDLNDGTLRNFKLKFPDGAVTTWSFSGYVTGFEPTAPVEGNLTADVTIKLSGVPTLA
jgi:hypothetical protein